MRRAESIGLRPRSEAKPVSENLPLNYTREADGIGPTVFVGVVALFALWACWFIYRTSFLAIDGRRYFSLFDDAMVSMRYAWNLAHGSGLVWNAGEKVEGYTNLLQTLIMSGFALFLDKAYAVLAVQVLGAAVMVLNGLLAVLVSRHIGLGRQEAHRSTFELLALVGVLWYYPLAYWSVMGMETGLMTGLILLGVLLAFRVAEKGDPLELIALSFVLGLAFLARPDSVVVSVVILAYGLLAFAKVNPGRRALGIGLVAVLLFVLLPIGQIIFRSSYYGSFWPNTYYLKVEGFPLTQRIRNGWAFMAPFFKENWFFLILAALALVHVPSKERLLLLVAGAILIAYQILIGGDAWRLWRMVSPGMPLLLLLFVAEFLTLARAAAETFKAQVTNRRLEGRSAITDGLRPRQGDGRRSRALAAALGTAALVFSILGLGLAVTNRDNQLMGVGQRATLIWGALLLLAIAFLALWRAARKPAPSMMASCLCLAFFVALGSLNARFLPEMLSLNPPYQVDENKANVDTAIALLNTTTGDASVGVIWAGTIPFYSGRYAIDFLGKTDPHIAHLPPELGGASRRGSMLTWPGHNKYDLEYSIGALKPTYVQTFDWGRQHLAQLKREEYKQGAYQGIELWLLEDSPSVLWGNLDQPDS